MTSAPIILQRGPRGNTHDEDGPHELSWVAQTVLFLAELAIIDEL
ncbi:MAG TPA: hypothetical protein VHN13_12710 [Candidatus Tectomicrobia bacterium]|nr:hypothetical protein [Candidatus Tectomicrobia bacterium]